MIVQANKKEKQSSITILTTFNIEFNMKNITRDEGYHIMIKRSP